MVKIRFRRVERSIVDSTIALEVLSRSHCSGVVLTLLIDNTVETRSFLTTTCLLENLLLNSLENEIIR